jgi:hypothetical protein
MYFELISLQPEDDEAGHVDFGWPLRIRLPKIELAQKRATKNLVVYPRTKSGPQSVTEML